MSIQSANFVQVIDSKTFGKSLVLVVSLKQAH